MKIIIAGVGTTGTFVTKYLSNEGIDITVIDEDQELVRSITDTESVAGIVGSCTSLNTLREAGIKNTDIFISISPDDETNIFSCYLANLHNVGTKIARIKDPNYLEDEWQELYRSGKIPIDKVISTNLDIFSSIEQKIFYSHLKIADIISFSTNKIKIFSVFIGDESISVNKTFHILQYEIDKMAIAAKIIGIYRKGDFFIPDDNDIIKKGDKVFVSASVDVLESAYSIFYNIDEVEFSILEGQQKNIIINGDSVVAKSLALELSYKYKKVKLVTKYNLSEKDILELEVNNVQTIVDDITQTSYRGNYIYSEDDIIIVTNKSDDDTILSVLLLNNQGMNNVFCYLNSSYYENFLLESNVKKHIFTADNYIMSSILPSIRRGVILSIFNIHNTAELVELEVIPNTYAVGRKISDIESPSLVICGLLDENQDNILKLESNPIIKPGYKIFYLVYKSNVKEAEDMFAQYIDYDVIM